MARYTGPVCKLCRREGVKLFLKGDKCIQKCTLDRRSTRPGQHGASRARKESVYGKLWREKQRVRRTYGVLERQFSKHFEEAARRPGKTSENLLQILEMRLDNLVYRLGFADSRAQARQLVNHGHFEVNGRKTDIPSFIAKPNDVITVREHSKSMEYFKARALLLDQKSIPSWLSLDKDALSGRVLSLPSRAELELPFDEQLVIEYYQR
ncbi:small subunit ribosomal protein S4 [Thermosporothrix hazakensis]|jgi:small subunit ribosomal protein S4|uniref:Small ribosomal subunit protein uS4 n=2 Tax=Thermosporothrix TaxID=768650 RepID=A0A326U8Z6_THEHA|nr:30S ribosomal protein S4 [Thermosporothrix hazakensis]PZW23297.1 small subunit ribosomal protein S4 [Thermosporothrix hazakensis]BBH89590.1 30S ribosomal protein S4 [Thermosporothrix sp. COM3]GCE47776.1 30S ribosomal protein S4 [Thermosporothrix hazakensis]